MYTNPTLKDEIILKKKYIEEKADVYSILNGLFDGALEREALEHSLRIEYPLSDQIAHSSSRNINIQSTNAIDFKTLSDNLKHAWKYGRKNFSIPFNDTFLHELAYKIDPQAFETFGKGFRTPSLQRLKGGSVRPIDARITPPYPAKIPLSMDRFYGCLNKLYTQCPEDNKSNCFDIGAYIHLHLARIHPFDDANGRTARMLHNLYLRNLNSFPPIIIYEGERKDYTNRLENAIVGFQDREGEKSYGLFRDEISQQEKEFYDYMAGKLNMTLDRIIEKK